MKPPTLDKEKMLAEVEAELTALAEAGHAASSSPLAGSVALAAELVRRLAELDKFISDTPDPQRFNAVFSCQSEKLWKDIQAVHTICETVAETTENMHRAVQLAVSLNTFEDPQPADLQ